MGEVEHVQENACCADSLNPLLQQNIGGDTLDNDDDEIEDDRASVTANEETVPHVIEISSNLDRLYMVLWISFLIISTLGICLYSTGYIVPGTVLLSWAALPVVGVLAISIGNRRRNTYQEI